MQSTSVPAATAGCVELAQAPAGVADPCTIVIFGATGHLAMRKLAPALYHLKGAGLLGQSCAVVRLVLEEIDPPQVQRDPELGARVSRIQSHHLAELADGFVEAPGA